MSPYTLALQRRIWGGYTIVLRSSYTVAEKYESRKHYSDNAKTNGLFLHQLSGRGDADIEYLDRKSILGIIIDKRNNVCVLA